MSQRKWTAEKVDELLKLASELPIIEVNIESPNRQDLDHDEVRYVCDDIRINPRHPDWTKAMQATADIVARIDRVRILKLRVPEAEPYRLSDEEFDFVLCYYESTGKSKPAKVRKRFQRLLEKLNTFLLYFAVYARPAKV
jgi:hypothetical protein